MTRHLSLGWLVIAAILALPVGARSGDPHHTKQDTCAALAKFKALAGDWTARETGEGKEEFTITYAVTSGGSAVCETIDPGGPHEMITMIHCDGPDLLLTHYCMLGNQPQMKASGDGNSDRVEFKFVRATNMASDKEMHMHDVTYTFIDTDTLRSDWTNYDDGKADKHAVFELKRK